jgi:hypothetical protein
MLDLLKRLSTALRSRKTQLSLAIRITAAAFGSLAVATALHLIPFPDQSDFAMYGNEAMDFTTSGLCST